MDSKEITLPCSNCIGCRLERSRQWALRLVHEKKFHEKTSFITLTYSDEKLPQNGSLDVAHFQLFMKKLRKSEPNLIRFFHAGEYGEKFGRPHYHAIIFGQDFKQGLDKSSITKNPRGDLTWTHPRLDALWGNGIARIGEVTFESCAYVARYVTKKVNGKLAKDHYQRVCEATGEIFSLKPEYCTMSRRPGIGKQHFVEYHTDIYPSDECISRGFPSKPPRFYDKQLEKIDPLTYLKIKEQRECALSLSPIEERSPRRLHVRETVKLAQISNLKRNYEIG